MPEHVHTRTTALLDELREKARRGNLTVEDLQHGVQEAENLVLGMLDLLEQASYVLGEEERAHIPDLQEHLAVRAYPVLFERIRRLAWALREELKEQISKSGYRLINLARAGRRDEVIYLLTRIFLARGKALPRDLVRIFSPAIPDEMFRTFLYAFVGTVSGASPEEKEGGER